jgi:hypothetical protein
MVRCRVNHLFALSAEVENLKAILARLATVKTAAMAKADGAGKALDQ